MSFYCQKPSLWSNVLDTLDNSRTVTATGWVISYKADSVCCAEFQLVSSGFINQSINLMGIAPILLQQPGSLARQARQCPPGKPIKQLCNINGPSGVLVLGSMRERPSHREPSWEASCRSQLRWPKGQIARGCSKGKGHKSEKPSRACWSWP